jgi:ParB-like chromosome segregation protein Spo0J
MKIQSVPIDSVHADPANARRHPERNLDAIRASLARFGQVKPIVVDDNGIVRAGNGTLEAAKQLGWTHISIVKPGLSNLDATAYAIADNRTAELAEWDDQALAETLRSLQSEEFDLTAVGFDDTEVDAILASLDVPDDADWSAAAESIPDGDKSPFQQMTFTVTDEQAEDIKRALGLAKESGPFVDTGNENSNGNALARIAESYLGSG